MTGVLLREDGRHTVPKSSVNEQRNQAFIKVNGEIMFPLMD
jgi:hypothetical protein